MRRCNAHRNPYIKFSENPQNHLTRKSVCSESFANSEQRTANSEQRTANSEQHKRILRNFFSLQNNSSYFLVSTARNGSLPSSGVFSFPAMSRSAANGMNEFCKYKTNAGLLGKFHKKSGKNEGLSEREEPSMEFHLSLLKIKFLSGGKALIFWCFCHICVSWDANPSNSKSL